MHKWNKYRHSEWYSAYLLVDNNKPSQGKIICFTIPMPCVKKVLCKEEDSLISYPIYLLEFLQGQFSSMFVSISPEKVLTISMSSSLNSVRTTAKMSLVAPVFIDRQLKQLLVILLQTFRMS